VWKEAVLAFFKIISQHWPGGTEENHETSIGITDSKQRFKLGCPECETNADCQFLVH
jgi:hypothetical protein